MNTCIRRLIPAVLAVWLGSATIISVVAEEFPADLRNLLSRLQSMSHGYFPASQWNGVIDDIHALIDRAEASGDTDQIIDVTLILAQVHSDMLGNHTRAIEILSDIKSHMAVSGSDSMPKVYVRLAEAYSKTGNETAILALIDEFKTGPYYDPEGYTVTGGESPGEAFLIQRPTARGDDSVSVTAMRRYLSAARFAPGRAMPDFETIDREGRPLRLAEYRGKLVLVDFWLKDWVAWKRDLPQLVQLHQRYQPRGFEIIGVSMGAAPGDLDAFLAQNGMTWRQVEGDRTLARNFGVVGEAANFLVDPNGTIVGRDLHGGELAAAIRFSLEGR